MHTYTYKPEQKIYVPTFYFEIKNKTTADSNNNTPYDLWEPPIYRIG